MAANDNAIESLRREMRERFDAVNERFDAMSRDIDRRFDEHGSGLRTLIESVQSDVRLILEHLAPTMTQVADHERRINALERGRRKPS